jgi:hypothetical protein
VLLEALSQPILPVQVTSSLGACRNRQTPKRRGCDKSAPSAPASLSRLSARPAIELTIDAASLQTGNRRRDRHLRSADFFDVENHPRVQFVSDSVDLQGETLKVRGRLAARGRSFPVVLDAQVRLRAKADSAP